MQADASGRVHAGFKENGFRQPLVHGDRAAEGIRTGVADAEQVECGLQLAVLALAAVKADECNVRHAAQFDHIRAEETVGLIRAGSSDRFQVRFRLADISGDLKAVSRHGEYILQIFRRILQSEKYIQQKRVMSFLKQSPADPCGGGQRYIALRA